MELDIGIPLETGWTIERIVDAGVSVGNAVESESLRRESSGVVIDRFAQRVSGLVAAEFTRVDAEKQRDGRFFASFEDFFRRGGNDPSIDDGTDGRLTPLENGGLGNDIRARDL